jgi:hypothetical protein
VSFITSPK